jgi:hypothetical protein
MTQKVRLRLFRLSAVDRVLRGWSQRFAFLNRLDSCKKFQYDRCPSRSSPARLKTSIRPPSFIESEIGAFREFSQGNADVEDGRDIAWASVFRDALPVATYDSTVWQAYVSGRSPKSCYLKEGITFGAPLYRTLRLTNADGACGERV